MLSRLSLFIFSTMVVYLTVVGQERRLDEKISIEFTDLSTSEALEVLSKTTAIPFAYSSRIFTSQQRLTRKFEDTSIEEILDFILLRENVDYRIVEDQLILYRSEKTKDPVVISGYVRDNNDGEVLIGATILVENLNTGVISNAYGYYALSLLPGTYTLIYSFVGYEEIIRTIEILENQALNVSLNIDASVLEEIIVKPADSAVRAETIHRNVTNIENRTLLGKPNVLGEADVIKSLEIIPGVQLFRDGSSFFNVRGGDRDQNQILVDDAPIYNPAHLLGIFSSFMPEAIKDLKLYKGDLPARLGGRISSVMDIRTRDGNMKKFGVEGTAGLMTGKLAVEGPIKKDKSSFFLSGRRSYIQSIVRLLDPDFNTLYFTDFNAKTNLRINQKNRLYLSTYIGKDEFEDSGSGIDWENKAGTIRWNHIFGDRLFLNTTFYTSKYEYNLNLPDKTWTNHIANVSLKGDFIFYKNPRNTIEFGFKSSGHNFNPGNAYDSLGEIPIGIDFVPKRNATEFSLYISSDQRIGQKLLLNYGIRLSSWTNFGRTREYEIDENYQVVDSVEYTNRNSYNDYSNLEPRLSLTYVVNKKNYLKFNYSYGAQYINLISNSISPFNNLEVWLPASVNIKPQLSSQVSMSWFREDKEWKVGLEGYLKDFNNQLDYKNQAQLLLNSHLEAELRAGDGTAYGLEATIAKTKGNLNGWLTYVYSRSFRTIKGINNDKRYSTLWDKPHQLILNINYLGSKRSTISGVLYVSSGSPTTTPTSFYNFMGRTVPIYESRNNSRLPSYNRFDVAWNYRLNRNESAKFQHSITISIFNLYGQKNSILENFNKIDTGDNNFRVPTNVDDLAPISTTKVFVYSIIPSISYSFRI